MPSSRKLFLIALLLGGFTAAPRAARAQADVIRGQVLGPDSMPVPNVTVTVTSISGNVNRTARTDKNGRFTVTFPGGDGDYLVHFAAIGYNAKRFEVKRAADEDILVADARLTKAGETLEAIKVTATRDKPRRNDITPDVSGTEQRVDNSGVPADLMGDLAAMAASLPGVQGVPGTDGGADGFSVLGLGADQNNTTLNGVSFGGSNLPRDAQVASSLVTSPYDVSRGGFSGAQFSLRTRPGSNFVNKGMSLNLDSPHMQWTDRATQSLGQEYSNVSLGGAMSGPIRWDRVFYNVAYQLGRRANDLQTLLTTDPVGLQSAGVSSDSANRLLSILSGAGVPVAVPRLGADRIGDQGSLLGSFDFNSPTSSSGTAVNVTFNGNWTKQSPVTGQPTEVPAHSGDRTSWRGGLQARHSTYIKNTVLSETSVSASGSKSYSTPFLDIPSGTVRVNSSFLDGTSSVQNLTFGGSSFLRGQQTTNSVGYLNQLSWFSTSNKHRLKLTSELRRDESGQLQENNLFGSYFFNSLADLQSGSPSAFTRQLSPRERSVSELVGGLSLGDSYRRSSDLQIQYGVRLDADRYINQPAANALIESTFHAANDFVPNRIYASPRLGFSWTYGKAAQISGFEGAARVPRAVVRGGVGVFQNTPGTNLIASAMDNTALPGALQQLTCIGAATPVPNWAAYTLDPSLIPSQCATGSTPSVFASTVPNASLISPDYRAPRSVRSNLQWNGAVLGNRFNAQLDGTYSLNLNQAGNFDLNFNGLQRFALADENGRPVYVQPSSIVPLTGSIASQDARVSQAFARVNELRSDLKSESRQLTLRLSPVSFNPSYSWSLSYVYSNVREQSRGFSSTVSNPLLVEWARSAFDSRHQIVYNLSYNLLDYARISWFGQFRSGLPFTPMIAGDVNGDGYSNDRAFVFRPGATADPALGAAMQSLLAAAPKEARNCLSSQLGNLAARNSCQGPWNSSATLSVSFNPAKVRMPQRATVSFQLSNPLGAADLLAHGSGNLHGWGQQNFPDPSLLYVRGFDPVAQRFKYEVNQRFGAVNTGSNTLRSPVTLTALMRFDLGPTRERQLLAQQLDQGRVHSGTKTPELFWRAIYGSGGIPNPLAALLRQQDTLKLSAAQADSIASLNRTYSVRNDQIWSPIATYYANLPDNYDRNIAYDRFLTARKATIDLLMQLGPAAKALLTPEQIRKLPAFISTYLEPRYLASIRNGTATFTGGFFNLGGGGGPGFGGGGGDVVIIRQ